MFFRVDGVTYVETQFDHSKLWNFISSSEIDKKAIKLCCSLFLHKINKNMQRNPGVRCFVYSRYDVIYAEFKSL